MINKFHVAGGHKDTVVAAYNVLQEGGNAFDAAIAGVFASMACEYIFTGVASGGAMMVQKNGCAPKIIDFFVDTPAINPSTVKDFKTIDADFGDTKQAFSIGVGSVGIPGTIPGLIAVHQEYASLPFSFLIEQAVNLAKKGSIISENQAYISEVLTPVINNSKSLKSLFTKNDSLLKAGDLFINSDLSSFLEQFYYEDAEIFYKNEVCPIFFEFLKSGGIIGLDDLQNYKPVIRKPIHQKYHNYDVFLNPPPSTGGKMIQAGLKNLKHLNGISYLDFEDALYVTQKVEVEDRLGSTTHLSIKDANNNVASVTTTNGVGAGCLIPGTGIMPNNMLGEKHLNVRGFHNWKHKQRIPSNICPTIMIDNNNRSIALGSAGSSRIISAILSVITNLINKKMSLKDSISKPRIHLEGDVLHCEPGATYPTFSTINKNFWKDKNSYFGGVNGCGVDGAAADERRDGSSI
tara:strand:+ start:16772 stop:18157 length:1386 start_codon:yes stop_codon:yes gene_type:complete